MANTLYSARDASPTTSKVVALTMPRNRAPANAAAMPVKVTAPDVPASTPAPVVINRGLDLLRTPNSVAHVSAVAADSAPTNPANRYWKAGTLSGIDKAARRAATPPLARTWAASRVPPFSNVSDALTFRVSDALKKERALDETKNATRITAQANPPRPKIVPPTRQAAIAPPAESAFAL
jgi:hypothetical protein